jgi:integrase
MSLMFRVAVLRGCRRGELCGFRWANAEMDKPYRDPATGEERTGAVLTVERPIVQLGGKLRESKAKTRAGKRRVFLDHDTAGLLREHRKAQLKVRLKAGEAWADNDLVFCQDDGQPWHPEHVSKRFKKRRPGGRAGGHPARGRPAHRQLAHAGRGRGPRAADA